MMALAALVHLPVSVIAILALTMIAGHNLLDEIRANDFPSSGWVWHFLHQPGRVHLGDGRSISVLYPLIPWIGVMAAGYAFGPSMQLDAKLRRRRLLRLGTAVTAGFVLLRATNFYGDPTPWAVQETSSATMLSFLNCEKYPPSLLFLMMTVGPALLLLAALDDMGGRLVRWLTTYGRVPFFFYVTHIYFIHGLAIVLAMFESWFFFSSAKAPAIALSLPGVYLVWLFVLILLYPVCRWFAALKQRRTERYWSYL
jgi:uncharacterized membrane protein